MNLILFVCIGLFYINLSSRKKMILNKLMIFEKKVGITDFVGTCLQFWNIFEKVD